jgi:threonine/homoserine/homoserine lactone efflux protein
VLRHSEAIVGYARTSGALVIFAVGLTLAIRPQLLESIKTDRKRQSFVAGFLTTALNPTLLATWTVTVTALHANGLLRGQLGVGLAFGVGVSAGAVAWFVLVGVLLRYTRPQLLFRHRTAFGRGIGVILTALGALLFWRAAWPG